jgi:hypothetical protein
VLLDCAVYSVLYSEIALSRKPFGIVHVHIYVYCLLRMADTMTSQNINLSWDSFLLSLIDRAISSVCRRLPTAAARIRAQVSSYWICGRQRGTGAGFLRVLQFPLPVLIPPTAPHSSSSIIRVWYNRPNSC